VFGHYSNELLLRIFEYRQPFLFTGLREPLSRAVSEFGQAIATISGALPSSLDIESHLTTSSNGLCKEILRCFPSVAQNIKGPLWEQARAALSLFDFIYSTEAFDHDCKTILDLLEVPSQRVIRDNSLSEKVLRPEEIEAIGSANSKIRTEAKRYYADDLRLYEEISPYLGKKNFREAVAGQAWALDRDRFVANLPKAEVAWERLRALEIDYLTYEFYSLGRLEMLDRWISSSRSHLDRISERLKDYGSSPS
jgi:hypothetical protein